MVRQPRVHQSGGRVRLEVDDRGRENARVPFRRPHGSGAGSQEAPVLVGPPDAPLAPVGRLADDEAPAERQQRGDGLLHAPPPEFAVPHERPVLAQLEHELDRPPFRPAEDLRQFQQVAVEIPPEMEAQQHAVEPEIVDRLDQVANRRRVRTDRDAQASERDPLGEPIDPAPNALRLEDRCEQRSGGAKKWTGMMGRVAQTDPEALATGRVLVRLVGERIPHRPFLSLRGRVGARDVRVGAPARQQQVGEAAQSPPGAVLGPDPQTETVVVEVEAALLKPGQSAVAVAAEVLGAVRRAQHGHPAEIPQALACRQPSPETGAVQIHEVQLGIRGRSRQQHVAGGQIPEPDAVAVHFRGQGADAPKQDGSVDPGETRRALACVQGPEHVAQFQGLRHQPAHEPGRALHGRRLRVEQRLRRRDAEVPEPARGTEAQARPTAPPPAAKPRPQIVVAELLNDHGDSAPVAAPPPRPLVQVAPAPVQTAAGVRRIEETAKSRFEVGVQVAGGPRVDGTGQVIELEPEFRSVHLGVQARSPASSATTKFSRCNSGSA